MSVDSFFLSVCYTISLSVCFVRQTLVGNMGGDHCDTELIRVFS